MSLDKLILIATLGLAALGLAGTAMAQDGAAAASAPAG